MCGEDMCNPLHILRMVGQRIAGLASFRFFNRRPLGAPSSSQGSFWTLEAGEGLPGLPVRLGYGVVSRVRFAMIPANLHAWHRR